MKRVAFVAYEGAQLLDISGPGSVFAETTAIAGPSYEVVIVSHRGGAVRTSSGIELVTTSVAEISPASIDTMILPGAEARDLRRVIADQGLKNWTKCAASEVNRLCSVCTGAFILASWKLLDGRRATTHWQAANELARLHPLVELEPNALFIEDGGIWTSAGVSTGIDMALAQVEADFGRSTATAVARRLVLQARRPGYQSQFSAVLTAQGGAYAELIDWIGENLHGDLSVDALSQRAGQAPRTFYRRFSETIGLTPAAYVEQVRLERARQLIEAGETVKRAAVLAGFGSHDKLGRSFRKIFGLTPSAYQAVHSGRAESE